jgi:hypothetical protein
MTTAVFNMPSNAIVLRRFDSLERIDAPFVVSVKGVVINVGSLTTSQAGSPKISFTLVDEIGSCVACMAFGETALNASIKDLSVILIFFACGRAGNHLSHGALFLWENGACIISLGKVNHRPQETRTISIE